MNWENLGFALEPLLQVPFNRFRKQIDGDAQHQDYLDLENRLLENIAAMMQNASLGYL